MASSAIGETQLSTLLATLQPQLQPTVYVYVTLPPSVSVPPDLEALGQFRETEGWTLIVSQAAADRAQLPYQYPCRLITLTVHSSLAAVGMLAVITQTLATAGISTNVISAYFHDHLLVPSDRAEEALFCLASLADESSQQHFR